MKVFYYSLILTAALSACPAQTSTPVNTPATPVPQKSVPATAASPAAPATRPSPATVPSTNPDTGEVIQVPVPAPSVQGSLGFSLPDNVTAVRFVSQNDRFLDRKGEKTTFNIELVDAQGNVVSLENVPLEFTSSRPKEFSVNEKGEIEALVNSGFSIIEVKITGTDFEARSVVNVNDASVGGGGGSFTPAPAPAPVTPQNAPPVINSLQASSTTVSGTGKLVKLTAAATDADDTLTDASYSWNCAQAGCSTFTSNQGTEVFWRSPATTGSYALKLTVTDGQASVDRDVNITVTTGQGNLNINP